MTASAATSAELAGATTVATSTPTPSTQGHARGQSSSQQPKKKILRKSVSVDDPADTNPTTTSPSSSSPPSNNHNMLSTSVGGGGIISTSVSSSFGSVFPLAASMQFESRVKFGNSSGPLALGGPANSGHYTPTSSMANPRVDMSKMAADGDGLGNGNGNGNGAELMHTGNLDAFVLLDMPPSSRD
ncbi:hypothetical protein BDN72DRAFT_894100 [Pluteus cervinus]|uniref:Uncharacterized protein n=1 Tax=Pluteus cervinus TaxID=181527 RepID=A0ACD3B5U3_9AGAR|nr:hypothetical protein BDN72DRAFT_894100 [Pluteus cervinus]